MCIEVEALGCLLHSPGGRWPARNWALLDVREQGEAYQGHIPSATALPRRLIEYRAGELIRDKTTQIIVYDSGVHPVAGIDCRADLARDTLRACGFRNVQCLEGGFARWVETGRAVAQGSNVPSKAFGERVLEEDAVPAITPAALHRDMVNGLSPVICDVRTSAEFAHHHLPGGISTPGFDLIGHLPEIEATSDYFVINCAGRTRSIIATATAGLLGMSKARALENGTMGWRIAGYETESETESERRPVRQGAIVRRAERLADQAGVEAISTSGLTQLLARDDAPYILDLRPLAAYQAGHIAGAIAVPGGQAIQRTDDFLAVPSAQAVLVDDGCGQAAIAGYWLKRMGFPHVARLLATDDGWLDSGLPIETGRTFQSLVTTNDAAQRVRWADVAEIAQRNSGQAPSSLDIRTSRDFARTHLPGSQWCPRGWLEHGTMKYRTDDRLPCLVARDDEQALLGAIQLFQAGFTRVEILRGGIQAWLDGGQKVDSGPPDDNIYLPDIVEAPYSRGLDEMKSYLTWEIALNR